METIKNISLMDYNRGGNYWTEEQLVAITSAALDDLAGDSLPLDDVCKSVAGLISNGGCDTLEDYERAAYQAVAELAVGRVIKTAGHEIPPHMSVSITL